MVQNYAFLCAPTETGLIAPLRAPLKVSDTVVGNISLVPMSDWCGHQCQDVHTTENRTDPSMFNIYIYIYIVSVRSCLSCLAFSKEKKNDAIFGYCLSHCVRFFFFLFALSHTHLV